MKPVRPIEKIVIVDFGSQFTQLIARKIRELGAYSRIINFKEIRNLYNDKTIKGIILSGGPLTVAKKKSAAFDPLILDLKVPVLGICYGHQILSKKFGGSVKISKKREFGKALIRSKTKSPITKNFFNKKIISVWMSHQDVVHKLPKNFKNTNQDKIAEIIKKKQLTI